jgi:hypothetical protein
MPVAKWAGCLPEKRESMNSPPRIWLDYRPIRIGWVISDRNIEQQRCNVEYLVLCHSIPGQTAAIAVFEVWLPRGHRSAAGSNGGLVIAAWRRPQGRDFAMSGTDENPSATKAFVPLTSSPAATRRSTFASARPSFHHHPQFVDRPHVLDARHVAGPIYRNSGSSLPMVDEKAGPV